MKTLLCLRILIFICLFFHFGFENVFKYAIILSFFYTFYESYISRVRHPSHPGRGHGSPTCHMTQYERSDWLKSADFLSISWLNIEPNNSKVVKTLVDVKANLWPQCLLYLQNKRGFYWRTRLSSFRLFLLKWPNQTNIMDSSSKIKACFWRKASNWDPLGPFW